MVVREPEARPQDLGRHRGRRRLAVRRGDERRPRPAAAPPAGRSRRDRASTGACPARSCRRPRRPGARGPRRGAPRESRSPSAPLEGTRRPGYLDRGVRAGPDPFGGGSGPGSDLRCSGLTCICGPVRCARVTERNERQGHAAFRSDEIVVIARTRFGDAARKARRVRTHFGVAAAVGPAWLSPWSRCSQWPRWPAQRFATTAAAAGSTAISKAYVPDTLLSAIAAEPDAVVRRDSPGRP